MKKYRCTVCGYVHTEGDIPENCPTCNAPKDKFVEVDSDFEQIHINYEDKLSTAPEVEVNPFFGDYNSLVGFVYNLPVGKHVPLHKHPTTDEMFFVLKGKIQFTIDGKEYLATRGDILQGKMNVPHGFKNIGDEPAAFLSVKGPKPVDLIMIDGE